MLLITATVVVVFAVPKPSRQVAATTRERNIRDLKIEAKTLSEEVKKVDASVDALVWNEGPESVSPKALDFVTKVAERNQVKLISFRPQKSDVTEGLTVLPFLMNVEGKFEAVAQFARDLETFENRLAVTQLSLALGEQGSDKVAASIGITAYLKTPEAAPTPSPSATPNPTPSSTPSTPTTP
jgi:Tfp pilus assembly protein PilO